MKKVNKFIIEGGKATAGPPIGPALGPLGVNVLAIIEKINELTSSFMGMRVPIEVIVDTDTKDFEVNVGIPSTAALIMQEIKKEKGAAMPGKENIGDISFQKIIEIAKIKMKHLQAKTLKSAVKQIIGTCVSMGVTIDKKNPKEVIKAIDKGEYDKYLKE
jgi:large subunit ribosomal protein L11